MYNICIYLCISFSPSSFSLAHFVTCYFIYFLFVPKFYFIYLFIFYIFFLSTFYILFLQDRRREATQFSSPALNHRKAVTVLNLSLAIPLAFTYRLSYSFFFHSVTILYTQVSYIQYTYASCIYKNYKCKGDCVKHKLSPKKRKKIYISTKQKR